MKIMERLEIRHHPADELLLQHAAGTLGTGMRLVMATHLELCAACRQRVAALRAVGGAMLEDEPPAALREGALERVMARIRALEAGGEQADGPLGAPVAPVRVTPPPPLPEGVAWPQALADCTASRWRWIGPGMRWCRVTVPYDPAANVFLLRIGAGKYLPQHTHRGIEMTQILHGRFHDGRALFGPGDFDMADGEVNHQPVVQEGSECICVATVDGRLAFDGLIARLLGSAVGM